MYDYTKPDEYREEPHSGKYHMTGTEKTDRRKVIG
jgi:hypothetical protein